MQIHSLFVCMGTACASLVALYWPYINYIESDKLSIRGECTVGINVPLDSGDSGVVHCNNVS